MPYGLFGTYELKTSAEHQILSEINVTYNPFNTDYDINPDYKPF